MGKKIDEAFYRIKAESEHHTRLAQAKNTDYENGFAQGFFEALMILMKIRG